MLLSSTAVGLDIGAQNIRAVEVRISGAQAQVVRSLAVSRADLVAEGVDVADPGRLALAVRERMAAAGIRTRGVILAVDGREAILRYSHVPPMPSRRLELVIRCEVDALSERMGEALASDFRVLDTLREDGEQTVLLGVAKETWLAAQLAALEAAGITVLAAVPAPLAIYSAWDLLATKADPDSSDDDLVLAVDMGSANLNIAVILNSRLVFARSVSAGGDIFTDALAKALGLSRDEAEKLKVTCGGVDASAAGVDARTVGPLRSAAQQLAGTLGSSLRFAGSQSGTRISKPTRLWFSGGGFQLLGLTELVAQALDVPQAESFDPAGVPLGLSAVGLSRSRRAESSSVLCILPALYRARRHYREHTVFLHIAAAILVLLLVARFAQGFFRNSATGSTRDLLSAQQRELRQMESEMNANRAEGVRLKARVNALLEEAEPTAFQSFLLEFLGKNMRPEFQIELVDLEKGSGPGRGERGERGGGQCVLTLRGRVNNESRRGHDWLIDLERQIAAQEERVRAVTIKQSRPEGAWYTFEMTVEPRSVSI